MFRYLILAFLLAPPFARAQEPPPPPPQIMYLEQKALFDWYIPVTTFEATAWRYVHQIHLPPLKAGDILQVTATGQLANDNQFRTELVSAVTIQPGTPYYHEDLWGITGLPGFSDFIVHGGGENIDGPTARHYMRMTHASQYRMPVDMPTAFLTFKVRARAQEAVTGSYYVYIRGPGYGKLAVTILRP